MTVSLSGSATPNNNNPPTKPNLADSANGSKDMPTTLSLKWSQATDPEEDKITYMVYYGTYPSFANVTPKIIGYASGNNNYIIQGHLDIQ